MGVKRRPTAGSGPLPTVVTSRDGSPKTDVLFSSPVSGTFAMTDALGTAVLDALPPGTNPVGIQTITSVITNITGEAESYITMESISISPIVFPAPFKSYSQS